MQPRRRPRPPTGSLPKSARPAAPAFTLVELMVSVALVLILVLGINAVFKMASDTVNVGMAMSSVDRDHRAVQPVLYEDVRTAIVTDAPFFIIYSLRSPAFRSRVDERTDRDVELATTALQRDYAVRSQDFDHNNTEGEASVPGEITGTVIYNARNHRRDRLQFFARNSYRRQTGSGDAMFDDGIHSGEAYIWYGFLIDTGAHDPLPPPTPIVPAPGPFPPPTVTNFLETASYTTGWNLGRVVLLLREDAAAGGSAAKPQRFYQGGAGLTPLCESQSQDRYAIDWSRYDVAQTSIDTYRRQLELYLERDPFQIAYGDIEWEDKLWYRRMTGFRFHGTRYPDRPLSPYGVARTLPALLPACSQFIVEYAGDYLFQDPRTGRVLGTYLSGPNGTDGQIDYVVVNAGPGQPARRVRWYGYPRNVDLSDDEPPKPVVKGVVTDINTMLDVVPLRDVLLSCGAVVPSPRVFFEHFVEMPPVPDYGATGGLPPAARYCAAWRTSDLVRGSIVRPKMLRVTLVADDPQARITEGKWCEFVMDLP